MNADERRSRTDFLSVQSVSSVVKSFSPMKTQRFILTVLSVITAVLLAGCSGGSKISQANYDKVKEGMAKADVIAILGEPTGTEMVGQINDTKIMAPIWQRGSLKIVIGFDDAGKVLAKRLD